MALDVSAAFNSRLTTAATHERDVGGGYDADGYAVPGTTQTTAIRASIQPLSAKEFDNMPEGLRDEAQAKVYTRFPLEPADRIIAGERYKVLSVDDWQPLGGYSRAILGALR